MASERPLPGRAEFATTHWSVVLAAREHDTRAATDALERLCLTYWYPLYAYLRRRGCQPADAEDLTQEFFARLLARDYLARADPRKGRFRTFLLSGVKYLLADDRDRARARKRGGCAHVVSFDQAGAEERYRLEPVDAVTPERLFEKSWVATLLEAVAGRLRDEYVAAGKAALYDHLCEFRLDATTTGRPTYAEVAARVGESEAALKSAIWRMRQRHRELLRDEIAHTVADPADVDDEIRYLLKVVA